MYLKRLLNFVVVSCKFFVGNVLTDVSTLSFFANYTLLCTCTSLIHFGHDKVDTSVICDVIVCPCSFCVVLEQVLSVLGIGMTSCLR